MLLALALCYSSLGKACLVICTLGVFLLGFFGFAAVCEQRWSISCGDRLLVALPMIVECLDGCSV
jgi:hypothetical protein